MVPHPMECLTDFRESLRAPKPARKPRIDSDLRDLLRAIAFLLAVYGWAVWYSCR